MVAEVSHTCIGGDFNIRLAWSMICSFMNGTCRRCFGDDRLQLRHSWYSCYHHLSAQDMRAKFPAEPGGNSDDGDRDDGDHDDGY